MAFTVELTSGEKTEFDDLARYTIDDSGALHITAPDERSIYAVHAWRKVIEHHDPRQPSSRFV
jgi:hypothetical protein